MTTTKNINNKVLEAVRDLIDASGPQTIGSLAREVETHCVFVDPPTDLRQHVEDHVKYLVGLGTLRMQSDEEETVYGMPGDF